MYLILRAVVIVRNFSPLSRRLIYLRVRQELRLRPIFIPLAIGLVLRAHVRLQTS